MATPAEEVAGADPRDWVARLAMADLLESGGRTAEGHLARGRAWLWAWAEAQAGLGLCFVHGMGRRPLVAHFLPGDVAQLRWTGWELREYVRHAQPPPDSVRVVYESPGHDVPADVGRQRRHARQSVAAINARRGAWLLPASEPGPVERKAGEPVTCDSRNCAGRAVPAGASVADFCAAVEAAGGWWLPLERNCATAT